VLDVVWALKAIQRHQGDAARLLDLFDVRHTTTMRSMAEKVLKKDARVYCFDTDTRETRDISDLDPGAEDLRESGWGGLTESSGHIADIVARVVGSSQ
jgi:hypothetical protein